MSDLHSFEASSRYAASVKASAVWEPFYRGHFTGFVGMVELPNIRCTAQLLGIDHVVTLSSGKQYRVDAKVRNMAYPGDFLLEYLGDEARGAPGWIEKDLQADYLAVIWMRSRCGALLPFESLRLAWVRRGEEWKAKALYGCSRPWPKRHEGSDGFCHVMAGNRDARTGRTWRTLSVCVPMDVLLDEVRDGALYDIPSDPPRIAKVKPGAVPEQLCLLPERAMR